MRTRIYVLLALAFTGSSHAQQANVPELYRGAWARPGKCGGGYAGSLTIAATEFAFLESTGKVVALRIRGPRDIEVDLAMRGGSDTWKGTFRFVLSEDDSRLTSMASGEEQVRVRCK